MAEAEADITRATEAVSDADAILKGAEESRQTAEAARGKNTYPHLNEARRCHNQA